jgi:hypothetical protein
VVRSAQENHVFTCTHQPWRCLCRASDEQMM